MIKIDDLYLTDTGLAGGKIAISSVSGLDRLYSLSSGRTFRTATGRRITQLVDLQGIEIDIEFPRMYKTVLDDVQDILTTYIAGGAAFTLDITGPAGDYTGLYAVFNWKPVPIEFGTEYVDDGAAILSDVRIHLATAPAP